MTPSCRSWVVVLALLFVPTLTVPSAVLAQDALQAPAVSLSPAEMRRFLAEAEIGRTRRIGKGVTEAQVATLSDGRVTHDAQIQAVDIARNFFEAGNKSEINFRDSYKYNIAAYELARLIGMTNVPMSVERQVGGDPAAVTWWLDDVLMHEQERTNRKIKGPDQVGFTQQVQTMYLFDELIQNVDRNQENILWDSDWHLWLIDHTRSFRLGKELKNPKQLAWCDRATLKGLGDLTEEALRDAVGRNLTQRELEAVMARRDLLMQHFDALIAERGEGTVMFGFVP